MRGPQAFCPSTGAPLSDERERPQLYRPGASPVRAPKPDDFGEAPTTPLSRGANYSSTAALKRYFRRSYATHAPTDDGTVVRQAAAAIERLKEPETDVHDDHLWFALAERLHRKYDYSAAALSWMWACVDLGCPHCYGVVTEEWRASEGEIQRKCAINCTDDNRYVDGEIRESIEEAYNKSFRRSDGVKDIEELRVVDVSKG
jgi:hypothetical protein